MRFFFLFFLCTSLFAVDYDVIVVGSSPFSLFEAIYQSHLGKKVLILEEAAECGGAWKSIHICGIPNVDLGCHEIGNNKELRNFLEEYAGCQFVDNHSGFYFSKGCHELIDHLLRLIRLTDIVLQNNTKVTSVSIGSPATYTSVHTNNQSFTTNKLIITPMSHFAFTSLPISSAKSKYFHLYLLVQDPTEPRFSYHGSIGNGITRIMNLTHFVGLTGTGQHLIVVQTHEERYLANEQVFLAALKDRQLVDPSAYILKSDSYIYESGTFNQSQIHQLQAQNLIDVLQTGHFQNLVTYIPKWKEKMRPYRDLIVDKD